jgi:hypothetical protein
MRSRHPLITVLTAAAGLAACSSDTLELGPEGIAGEGFSDVTVVVTPPTSAGEPESTAAADGDEPWPYTLGNCVTWDQDEAVPEFQIVSCEDEHLVEITTVYAIEASGEGTFPTLADLDTFSTEYCDPAAVQYLQADLGQDVEAGAIPPTPEEWSDGERWIACTVGQTRVDGKRPAYTGRLQG